MKNNPLKKMIQIPYRDNLTYPSRATARELITAYCAEGNWTCEFVSDDEVLVNGVRYEIRRGIDIFSFEKGGYGIRLIKI